MGGVWDDLCRRSHTDWRMYIASACIPTSAVLGNCNVLNMLHLNEAHLDDVKGVWFCCSGVGRDGCARPQSPTAEVTD